MGMFQIDDTVVYPGHGVATVQEVIERVVAGSTIVFLKLSFMFKDMTILVPTYNVDSIGIRFPNTEKELEIILQELAKKPERKLESIDFTPSGWNKRNKDYQLKIQGGKLVDIIKIYRDFMHISHMKELSFGERTLLQSIEDLIVQELQIIKNLDRDVVLQYLRNPFKEFFFQDNCFVDQVASAL